MPKTSEAACTARPDVSAPCMPGNSFAEDTPSQGDALEVASNAKRQETGPLYQRQKAHQEKNKRAQKRYRDRKRQQAEEQKQTIEQLSAQIQDLTVSKSRLESRCQLLEKVVGLREQAPAPLPSSALVRRWLACIPPLPGGHVWCVSKRQASAVSVCRCRLPWCPSM